MEEKQLIEDVEFIRQMVENNRRSLVDNGISYIATGVFIVVGASISYLLEVTGKGDLLPWLWLSLMALLIAFNIIIQGQIEKRSIKKTFASRIFADVWLACGMPIIIVSVLFFTTRSIPLNALMACVSSCLGIGYYLTGSINDLKFMKYLAFGWWAGVAVSILWKYIGYDYQLGLLFTALILLLEVIPGIIIYKKWKNTFNGKTI
ncbi:MAG: hypothetical protein ACM3Q2_04565 [Syntrophothermus sp.]